MSQYEFLINGPVYNEAVYTWQNVIGGVLDIVRIVVTGICLIALTILAIKYFTESPTVKSEQKTALPYYIIGIVILLGVANILPFLIDIVSSILSNI